MTKTINYSTLLFSFVSMIILLLGLFKKDNLVPGGQTEKASNEKSNAHKRSIVLNKIDKEIPEDEASDMTTTYRAAMPAGQTMLIVHKSSDLTAFLKNNFDFYTAKVNPPAGYEWVLGVCPMYFTQGSVDKLTLAFIPALQEKSVPKHIVDYWQSKEENNDFYKKYFEPLHKLVKDAGFKSFIYDEGQLWP